MAIYKYDPASGVYVPVDDSQLIADPTLAATSVSTNQSDYAPGSTAYFTANVGVGDTVTFEVTDVAGNPVAGTNVPWTVVDGGAGDLDGLANGVVVTAWDVGQDALGESFVLSATDTTSGVMTTTAFTDSITGAVDVTNQSSTAQVNGAIFTNTTTAVSTGTGVFDSFLVMQNAPTESGFNTDGTPLPLDDKSQAHTNALLLDAIPTVVGSAANGGNIGVLYREFRIDINQSGSKNAPQLISLDQLKIYQAGSGTLTDLTGLTPIFDLDGGGDKTVLLNAQWDAGSGKGDYVVLIADSLFDHSGATPNVYLYSAFGGGTSGADAATYAANSGFEEWGVLAAARPSINIDKVTGDGPGGLITDGDGVTITAGSPVTWTYTVTNTGNVGLSNIEVTDDHGVTVTPTLAGGHNIGDTNQDNILDVTETWIYTAKGTAVDTSGLPGGQYHNIGTVTGDYVTKGKDGTTTHVSDTDPSSYIGVSRVGTAIISIDKVTFDGDTSALTVKTDFDSGTDGATILANENVSWIYKITNPGDVALSNVHVTDNQPGVTPVYLTGDTNSDGKLDTNETWYFSASGKAIDGLYQNVGEVSGDPPVGITVSDQDLSGYTGVTLGIAINKVTVDGSKSGDGLTILSGEGISWQYTVTNTGNVALSDVAVTDSVGGVNPHYVSGDANSNGLLETSETWIFAADGTAVTGNYKNTGTATGSFTDDAGHKATPSAHDASNYFGANPGIAINKVTVDGSKSGDGLTILSGEGISWQYTVTNTGDVALSDVAVTDSVGGVNPHYVSGDANSNGLLETSETWIFAADGTAVTGNYKNTGTATGSFTDDAGHKATPSAQDDSNYFGANPGIAINKVTVDGSKSGDGLTILSGEGISWQYMVTNTGNVALSDVAVTDSVGGVNPQYVSGDANSNGLLETSETWIFSADGTAVTGNYKNTGTATGSFTDDAGHKAAPSAQDDSNYFGANPGIAINKVTVDGSKSGDGLTILSGEAISWQYTVTNTGNVALSNVAVTDSVGGVNPHYVSGDANSNGLLETSETWIFSADGTAVTGNYKNTGTATGSFTDDAGHEATPSAQDASNYFGADPEISINKITIAGNQSGDGINVIAGTSLTWKYTVTNTGNVALSNVTVTDDKGVTPTYVSGDTNGDHKLDLNETWIYQATGKAIEGGYSNTGTATGSFTDTAGHTGTDTASDPSSYNGYENSARTQGYWGSHASAWNTHRTDKYLLLGDANGNGIQDDGANAHYLKIDVATALSIESSAKNGDAISIMLAQVIATQLNIDAGVVQPNNLIDEAVMWLTGKGAWAGLGVNVDTNNDLIIDKTTGVATNSNAWNKTYVDVTDASTGITDWGTPLGKEADGEGLKNALMAFNQNQLVTSSGSPGWVGWTNDGVNVINQHENTLDQFWLTLHQTGGIQGIA
ncbi:hypothetical protein N2603_28900 [Bradyrhizobium huanghuaihaiense]|uniref:beta strand repeat-containing protein n=1 Tax=Bradyrhizobium huanghuaihaiense TaxID=990078 RepID=UPI0021AAE7BB|nr:hypothetical protein [Bradyrhizobium sp. CB3035]UWU74067.1 hypothetical protein N2603_28900 [Bradyrhizobium sp. CB3035]